VADGAAPPTIDWQSILDHLYARKGAERSTLSEGDPRKYQDLAESMKHQTESSLE
jgi:phycocyanobilin lyase subunit beta